MRVCVACSLTYKGRVVLFNESFYVAFVVQTHFFAIYDNFVGVQARVIHGMYGFMYSFLWGLGDGV